MPDPASDNFTHSEDPGRAATAPVQIYNLFLQSRLTQSAAAAVVLLIVTLATFLVFRTLASGRLLTPDQPCLPLRAALPSAT